MGELSSLLGTGLKISLALILMAIIGELIMPVVYKFIDFTFNTVFGFAGFNSLAAFFFHCCVFLFGLHFFYKILA